MITEELDRFWALIEADLSDPTSKLVMADRLREQADPDDECLAYALEWMARRKKWPWQSSRSGWWRWCQDPQLYWADGRVPASSCLPQPVFQQLTGGIQNLSGVGTYGYDTTFKAVLGLAHSLESLKAAYGLADPGEEKR